MKKWIVDNKKLLLLALALVVILAVLGGLYLANRPQIAAGAKQINVTVVDAQQKSEQFTITTDAPYLRGALEQQNLIAGDDTTNGLYVKTVNGITVDDSKQEWWCFTKGGEALMTGVDLTPIADGDTFTITLTTGY